MFDFLIPKTKVQAHSIREVPIDTFSIIGIGQINPYCQLRYDNEIFLTVVNLANISRKFDEKEGIVFTKRFTTRRCPKCGEIELIPLRVRLNLSRKYLKNEKDLFYDYDNSFYEGKHTFPSTVGAFCNSCNCCFEILIKSKDLWAKEARKIKDKELVTYTWDTYKVD